MTRLPVLAGLLMLASTTQCSPAPSGPEGGDALLTTSKGAGASGSQPSPGDTSAQQVAAASTGSSPASPQISPALPAEEAPPESARIQSSFTREQIAESVGRVANSPQSVRGYVQLDKALYKPGETIWARSWLLRPGDVANSNQFGQVTFQLVSPRGAVVVEKIFAAQQGVVNGEIDLPPGAQGGEYKLRIVGPTTFERTLVVSSYEPPRIKKKMEFIKKAYGPGDEVSATVEIKKPTGEVLANRTLTAVVNLDGGELEHLTFTTNKDGAAVVQFKLPRDIVTGDGQLTVLVDEGGVTESITKRIPIVLRKVQLQFFPEGGDLVAGLPGRIYFEARNSLGKPADVEGVIIDDKGKEVGQFGTWYQGLGRATFNPELGRSYHARITRPQGVEDTFALPVAKESGCVLRSYDDLDGITHTIRAAVHCTQEQEVIVSGVLRHNLLDYAQVKVPRGAPAVVYLKPEPQLQHSQGAVRLTLSDPSGSPMAERMVYFNRRSSLDIKVEPNLERYSPRDKVSLNLQTFGPDGSPVSSDVALAVVDDTVVSFADDKTAHILSRIYIEPEINGTVEEPNTFVDLKESRSALALDTLMGARGYRKLEPLVLPPEPMYQLGYLEGAAGGGAGMAMPKGGARMAVPRRAGPLPPQAAMMRAADPMMEVLPQAAPPPAAAVQADDKKEDMAAEKRQEAARENEMMADQLAPAAEVVGQLQALDYAGEPMANGGLPGDFRAKDAEFGRALDKAAPQRVAQAPKVVVARVFPTPVYAGPVVGPRSDFRETIYWAPSVITDKDGRASVDFYLSDAVTSFRVFAEGTGGAALGHSETVFESSLPFSMAVKLPVEVSAGDQLLLPLTLTNNRSEMAKVELDAQFGQLLTPQAKQPGKVAELQPGSSSTLYYPVDVTGVMGQSQVQFTASAEGLGDSFVREVSVVPVGFPKLIEESGQVEQEVSYSLDLTGATPGSFEARVTLYPSPLATLVSGLDGILRQPSGCFEQTSSTNYPNVMVLQYLKQHQVADVALLTRAQALVDDGYKRLVGFETPEKGYEWFGSAPGHEALTAYGLVEFLDMKQVYSEVDPAMVDRTARWILSRRDGKGGFVRNERALDSFGAASPDVTNAYITWSLTEGGYTDLGPEIEYQAKMAAKTKDPYLLALASGTLLNVPSRKEEGLKGVGRLVSMQDNTGVWKGADHSITRSGGQNLDIETTSLALLALMEAGGFEAEVRKGIGWLQDNRSGYGEWGATQATVLALKTMTVYAEKSSQAKAPGKIKLKVNGKVVAEHNYEAGDKDAIILSDWAKYLSPGRQEITLVHEGKAALPFSLALEYRLAQPQTDDGAPLSLVTTIANNDLEMGATTRMNVAIRNMTTVGQPMSLARIGLPGGVAPLGWQLKELREKGLIAFYETRPREVILYFRDMKPGETKEIPIDLVALIPGNFTAPPSSVYLYYTDELKFWAPGLDVKVVPR